MEKELLTIYPLEGFGRLIYRGSKDFRPSLRRNQMGQIKI